MNLIRNSLAILFATTCVLRAETLDLIEFANDIKKFQTVRKEIKTPEYLLKKDGKRDGKEFDLSIYFDIFDRIRLKSGITLDWVYSYQSLGGSPCLYARKTIDKPYATHSEYLAAIRKEAQLDEVEAIEADYTSKLSKFESALDSFADPFEASSDNDNERAIAKLNNDLAKQLAKFPRREYWNWWRESLLTDDSPQAYAELAALYLLAEQFALFWHALYDDLEILPDKAAIQERINRHYYEFDEEKKFIPKKIATKALQLDPTPQVKMLEKTVEVKFLTFSKWSGFQRTSIVISKTAPHVIISKNDEPEVFWLCGITY